MMVNKTMPIRNEDLSHKNYSQQMRTEAFRQTPIDGMRFKMLAEASLMWLQTNKQNVNVMNVFPVPDGDTGTNMVLTLESAWDSIKDLDTSYSLDKIALEFSKGALMGARGNSGVILSQILRGFSRGVQQKAVLDKETFIEALGNARDTAYKGVVRQVEGTILTVIKEMARSAEMSRESAKDVVEMLEIVVKAADEAVKNTPELLPVLKQAGVVDAGGLGLFYIMEGMLRFIQGLSFNVAIDNFQSVIKNNDEEKKAANTFISYARIDVDIVESIYGMLLYKNHHPWMDIHDIHGGENWLRAIYKAIEKSDIFIAVLSNNSVSRRGIIQKELKKALDKWDGMLPDDIYIIPIRIDDCPIPELLKHIQILEWNNGNGEKKLLEAIKVGLRRRKNE